MAKRWPSGTRRTPISQFFLFLLPIVLVGVLYLNISYLVNQSQRRGAPGLSDADYHLYSLFGEDFLLGRYRPRECRPQTNFVFIKCMKCATETLATVFRRYSHVHNLSVVLPIKDKIYIGWPFPITPLDYRPSDRPFNSLIEHAVYNGTFMRDLMAPGTVFLTMLREPADHFVSVLNYFNVFNLANTSVREGMAAVHDYLHNLDRYETFYKSPAAAAKRYCIPDNFSVSKNLLSHCHGMPLGFPPGSLNITDDTQAVQSYMEALDKEFLLVMMMEYFDESLVLLRRLMCWTTKDVLYHQSNVGSYRKTSSRSQLPPEDLAIHRKWSSVDYQLYRHFNRTFWNKVGLQGPDFFYEVDHFRQVHKAVMSYCLKLADYKRSHIEIPESFWSPAFNVTASDCELLKSHLLEFLKKDHDSIEPKYADYPKFNVKRKYRPLC